MRPLHPDLELGHENVISQPLQNQIQVKSDLHYDMRSQFDFVFNNASQDEVYEQAVLKMLPQFLNGYNSTIFTYGQTGSGKTFTMFGPQIANRQPRQREPNQINHRNRFSETP